MKFASLALTPLLLTVAISCKSSDTTSGPAPLEIPVAHVVKKDVPIKFEFVGQTKGAIDAEVRARTEGAVLEMHFEEGKEVKEGQLLYVLDPAPYAAQVAEAKGKLAEAETKLTKAESDLKRYKPLAAMNAVSKRDLDAAVAQEGSARGSLEAAKASVESAEIQLGYTKILSPTTGTIGITKAKVGEFVGKPPNPVILNTVSKLDPINVRFAVTERDYLYFARQKQAEIAAGTPAEPKELTLLLADGSEHPQRGKVVSVNREIDASTGTITVEASFPNPNKLVRPGQFAKIRVIGDTVQNGLLIPKRAIRELQGQYQVFVVGKDNTVEQRTIKPGAELDNLQLVESGIQENDLVVVEGIQRLTPGTKIEPKIQTQG